MRSPILLVENSWETKMWAPSKASALTGSSLQQYPPLGPVAASRGPHPCLNYERPRLRSSNPRLTCSMRAFLTCSPTQAHWEPTTWLAPISVSTEGCDSAETSPLAAEALPAHQLPCFPLAVQPVHSRRNGRQGSSWSSSFSVSLYYAAPCLHLYSAWEPGGPQAAVELLESGHEERGGAAWKTRRLSETTCEHLCMILLQRQAAILFYWPGLTWG